jgi:hypothetical protein
MRKDQADNEGVRTWLREMLYEDNRMRGHRIRTVHLSDAYYQGLIEALKISALRSSLFLADRALERGYLQFLGRTVAVDVSLKGHVHIAFR